MTRLKVELMWPCEKCGLVEWADCRLENCDVCGYDENTRCQLTDPEEYRYHLYGPCPKCAIIEQKHPEVFEWVQGVFNVMREKIKNSLREL